jgi:hypothetical protein
MITFSISKMAINDRNNLNSLKFLKETMRRGEETICGGPKICVGDGYLQSKDLIQYVIEKSQL